MIIRALKWLFAPPDTMSTARGRLAAWFALDPEAAQNLLRVAGSEDRAVLTMLVASVESSGLSDKMLDVDRWRRSLTGRTWILAWQTAGMFAAPEERLNAARRLMGVQ